MTAAGAGGSQPDELVHLAEMIALMGLPPKDFLHCSPMDVEEEVFDENGQAEVALKGTGRDNAGFLHFIRLNLQWVTEDRPAAVELLKKSFVGGRKNVVKATS